MHSHCKWKGNLFLFTATITQQNAADQSAVLLSGVTKSMKLEIFSKHDGSSSQINFPPCYLRSFHLYYQVVQAVAQLKIYLLLLVLNSPTKLHRHEPTISRCCFIEEGKETDQNVFGTYVFIVRFFTLLSSTVLDKVPSVLCFKALLRM